MFQVLVWCLRFTPRPLRPYPDLRFGPSSSSSPSSCSGWTARLGLLLIWAKFWAIFVYWAISGRPKQPFFSFLVISLDPIWLFAGYFWLFWLFLALCVCELEAVFIYYFRLILLYGFSQLFGGLSNNLLAYSFVFSALYQAPLGLFFTYFEFFCATVSFLAYFQFF